MLSLKNISLQKGSFTLKSVSFDVNECEYFVILGRTGSGKTLLLESLAGLHKHTGKVSYCGRDLTNTLPEKRKIGFVYQDFALFPHLSVIQNIRFSDRYQKEPQDNHWEELIEFLDLQHLLHRDIRYLSGGEKQRVALARAIHSRPDILLLDEPLSAIDPSFRDSIMANLKGLNHRFNITVVHVTHNFREAAYLADNIGIMMDGKLVQEGPAQNVLNHPETISIARFLGVKNILPGRLIKHEGRYFSINANLINIGKNIPEREYHINGECLEVKEDLEHYSLKVEADGCLMYVKVTKLNYDPRTMHVGAILQLNFSQTAVTLFDPSENYNEVSV